MKLKKQLTLGLLTLTLFSACSHNKAMNTQQPSNKMTDEEAYIFVERAIAGGETELVLKVFQALGPSERAVLLEEGQKFLQVTDYTLSEMNIKDAFTSEQGVQFLEKFRAAHPTFFKSAELKEVTARLDKAVEERGSQNLDANSTTTAGSKIANNQIVVTLRHANQISPKVAHSVYRIYKDTGFMMINENTCTTISKFGSKPLNNTELTYNNVENAVKGATNDLTTTYKKIACSVSRTGASVMHWSKPTKTGYDTCTHCNLWGQPVCPYFLQITPEGLASGSETCGL